MDQDTAEGVDIGLLMSAEERKLPGALFFDVLDYFKPGVFIQPGKWFIHDQQVKGCTESATDGGTALLSTAQGADGTV